jgi:hypothetical protein
VEVAKQWRGGKDGSSGNEKDLNRWEESRRVLHDTAQYSTASIICSHSNASLERPKKTTYCMDNAPRREITAGNVTEAPKRIIKIQPPVVSPAHVHPSLPPKARKYSTPSPAEFLHPIKNLDSQVPESAKTTDRRAFFNKYKLKRVIAGAAFPGERKAAAGSSGWRRWRSGVEPRSLASPSKRASGQPSVSVSLRRDPSHSRPLRNPIRLPRFHQR